MKNRYCSSYTALLGRDGAASGSAANLGTENAKSYERKVEVRDVFLNTFLLYYLETSDKTTDVWDENFQTFIPETLEHIDIFRV